MSLPLNAKLARILTFLVGLKDPRIFAVLSKRGFSEADRDEGFRLLMTAAGGKLRYLDRGELLPANPATQTLAALDEWENTWFPVASATLERHYPTLHTAVFTNLSATRGAEVLVSVATLLDRLRELETQPEGPAALGLLQSRGLTPSVRAEAAALIAEVQSTGQTLVPTVDQTSLDEQQVAQEHAWAWYLEWSRIARTVVRRADMLVRLGLRRARPESRDDDSEGDADTPPDAPAVPAA